MCALKLFLLGAPRIESDGALAVVKRRRGLALLAYLAVASQPQRRDALTGLLWPESAQDAARQALRRDLSELNLALGGQWFEADRETVGLRSGFWLDVDQFQRHLDACAAAPDVCLPHLTQAVALYREDFLAGFTLSDAPAFDEWQSFQTETLRQACGAALERLAELLGEQGDTEAAIPHALRRLSLDPLHEPTHRQLMRLYVQAGQPAAALRQYEHCRRVLDEELGVPPAPETTLLYDEIRERKARSVPAAVATPRPATARAPRHNLPTQTTPFIGREQELADIHRLLLDEPGCRLLNLFGPGGIGKTRLALAAAAQTLDAFPDGVYLVSLASVGEEAFIAPAIAEALRFTFYGQSDPKTQLLDYLNQKQLLLVIDNFEHLLEGADLLSAIVRQAPGVTVLATSRERLNLQEEWVFEVQGLSFPVHSDQASKGSEPFEVLDTYSAVQLFLQRARQTKAGFTPTADDMADIGRICQLVEGMPLGLELAAPWIRSLSCREIAAEIAHSLDFLTTELRNVPERHRSLRAVFEQTWGRMSQAEQAVLMRLSVFRGGCTREAAEAVAGATLPVLSSLVDKALLHRTNLGRYELHELIRQFAQIQLQSTAQTEVQAIHREHALYFLDLVGGQERALFGSEPGAAIAVIQADIDNVQLAWNCAVANRQTESLTVVVEPLARFLKMTGLVHLGEKLFAATDEQAELALPIEREWRLFHGLVSFYRAEMLYLLARYQEGKRLADDVHALGSTEQVPTLQAQAQILLGQIAYKHGKHEQARHCFEQGHTHCLQIDNERLLAHALDNLGNALHTLQVLDFGLACHQQACQIAQAQQDRWALAIYLSDLGWMHYDKWEHEAALGYFHQALALQRQLNSRFDMIETQLRIGYTHHRLHEDEQALEQFHQALQITEELGLKDKSQGWLAIGACYARKGDWIRAMEWLEKASHQLLELGKFAMLADCTNNIARIFAGRGEYALARLRHQEALDIYTQLHMLHAASHQHCHLGMVYHRMRDHRAAQNHLEQALALSRTLDDRAFLPQILQEYAELAFSMEDYAAAQRYCDECQHILRNADAQQHFYRQAEVTLAVNLLQARLTSVYGDVERAIQHLEMMFAATERPVEQAAIHYTRWQLDQDSKSGQQALRLYQQLCAQEPYYRYRQRIEELNASD